MNISKFLLTAALAACSLGAQAATSKLFSFNAPAASPVSFFVEADDDSILGLSVVAPSTVTGAVTYDTGLSFIDFGTLASPTTITVKVDLSGPNSTALFGAANASTGALLPLTAVPEPETLALALAGVAVAGVAVRRRAA